MSHFNHLLNPDMDTTEAFVLEEIRHHVEDTNCRACAARLRLFESPLFKAMDDFWKSEAKALGGDNPAFTVNALLDLTTVMMLNLVMGIAAKKHDGKLSVPQMADLAVQTLNAMEEAVAGGATDYLNGQLRRNEKM